MVQWKNVWTARSCNFSPTLMRALVCEVNPTQFPLLFLRSTETHKKSQDTSCTALWVAVSGDWESLSSWSTCCKPCSSGCHSILEKDTFWDYDANSRQTTRTHTPGWVLSTLLLKSRSYAVTILITARDRLLREQCIRNLFRRLTNVRFMWCTV